VCVCVKISRPKKNSNAKYGAATICIDIKWSLKRDHITLKRPMSLKRDTRKRPLEFENSNVQYGAATIWRLPKLSGFLTRHCSTLQHAATRCNELQCTAIPFNLKGIVSFTNKPSFCEFWPLGTATHLQHSTTHGNTLHHTATHCNTLRHTSNIYIWCKCHVSVTCFSRCFLPLNTDTHMETHNVFWLNQSFLPLSWFISGSFYVCVCAFTCKRGFVCVSLFLCVCACMCVCVFFYVSTCLCFGVSCFCASMRRSFSLTVCVCLVSVWACACGRANMHARAHVCVCARVHVCVCVCVCVFVLVFVRVCVTNTQGGDRGGKPLSVWFFSVTSVLFKMMSKKIHTYNKRP